MNLDESRANKPEASTTPKIFLSFTSDNHTQVWIMHWKYFPIYSISVRPLNRFMYPGSPAQAQTRQNRMFPQIRHDLVLRSYNITRAIWESKTWALSRQVRTDGDPHGPRYINATRCFPAPRFVLFSSVRCSDIQFR